MNKELWAISPLAVDGPGSPDWAKFAEEAAGLGYWRLDVATRAITWSDGLFRLYGLAVGDLPELSAAMAAIHPEDSERANDLLRRAMELGEDYADQVRLKRADGAWRVLTNRSICARNARGDVTTVFGVVSDVTEMEMANQALRASEARYRVLAENGTDLIVQIDDEGVITYMSPSSRAVTGFAPEELLGRNVGEMIHSSDMPGVDQAVEEALEHPTRLPGCIQYRVRHKDGRLLWLESRPTPLIDPETGKSIGVTDVVRDITERKALEDELLAKCEEAKAATRAKAEFLANMSHEIRTPLTAIVGFSGLLEAMLELPETAREYVRWICSGGEQLMGVVNDVLDFSKLDAGQISLDRRAVELERFVAETVHLLSGQAASKALDLRWSCEASLPTWVSMDLGRARQILLNLVGNAIKFTASGSVAVNLAAEAEGMLKFTVVDTGPGIPPDLQDRLFQRFSQVDASISRDHGGAGLGLAICKGLVELMGGALGVSSTPGEGSVFWLTLRAPEARAPQPKRHIEPVESVGPMRILLVDDLDVNRQLVRAMLAPEGHTFDDAASGRDGVQAAIDRPFDLILMDLQMPGMSGVEAARMIRSHATANCETPIVALSANVLPEQIAECYAAGMNDHLAKPIVPAVLLATVGRWAHVRGDARASAAAGRA